MTQENFTERILSFLEKIPVLDDQDNRKLLLKNLPPRPVSTFKRKDNVYGDFVEIVKTTGLNPRVGSPCQFWQGLRDKSHIAIARLCRKGALF